MLFETKEPLNVKWHTNVYTSFVSVV